MAFVLRTHLRLADTVAPRAFCKVRCGGHTPQGEVWGERWCGGRVAVLTRSVTPPADIGRAFMKRLLPVLLATGALLFAACGDDSDSDSAATTAG